MKKSALTACILLVAIVFSLAACGSAPLNDEGFLKNLQKGLEARWTLTDKAPTQYNSNAELKESYTGFVNAELSAIGDISAYTFENKDLETLAKQYCDALGSQLEAVKYYGSDDNKYYHFWTENGYNQRARAIALIAEQFELKEIKNHASELEDLIEAGRYRLELDKELEAMEAIISGDVVLECLGGAEHEIVLKNSSEYDLSNAQINFNLYDDRDVLVDSPAAYFTTWKSGMTNQYTIYSDNQIARAEASIMLYVGDSYDLLETAYHPIEYVNNMKIEITLKNELPAECEYVLGRSVISRCQVTAFSFQESYWSDGKASCNILISGTKTYEAKGILSMKTCEVDWKLYDESGIVVDTGMFWVNNMEVGDSFRDASSYVTDLAPGTYVLELMNQVS